MNKLDFSFGRFLLLPVLVMVLTGSIAWAQSTELSGRVYDPQKAVVPGVDITLTSSATGAVRTTISDEEGKYRFPQVKPGVYNLRAELPGFKITESTGIRLLVDTPMVEDIRLELGEVTEVITVASSTEKLMNEVNASIGNTFNNEQIIDLPLNTRNVYELLSIQPGVTQDGEVAGARSDQSNLTLDGIDVNEQQKGTAFTAVLRMTPDSVQEFRVTTSSPNSSQGRSSGAQVSLVTKSGTNDLHGSAYLFHRNTVTAANDFFNNRIGIDRPKLIRNLFGGSIGGPIVKEKAFFFFNYEGRTDRSEESDVRNVPMAHLGQGVMKYVNDTGNIVTVSPEQFESLYPDVGGANPLAVAALAEAASRYPANDSGVGDALNIGGFRFNGSAPLNWHTYIARLDLNLSDNQSLFLRGNYQWDHDVSPTIGGNERRLSWFPDSPLPTLWSHPFGVAAGHTWMISPSLVNTFRYGLTRQAFSNQGDSSENLINFRFVFAPRDFSRTLSRTTPLHNITNDMSWIKGDHTLQFGTNIRLISNNRESYGSSFDLASMNPSYYSQSGGVLDMIQDYAPGQRDIIRNAATALIGRYTEYGANFLFDADGSLVAPGNPSLRDFATQEYEFYFEDTWQATNNLTLNLGLRWGVNTPVYETSGFQVKPTTSLSEYFDRRVQGSLQGVPYNEIITVDLAGPFYNKEGFYKTDYNNFSPRVSFAYSPSFEDGLLRKIFGGPDESVIRGGFSMMYDRIGSQLAVSFDLNNTLGFASAQEIAANTYDVTGNPGPLFTGFDQDIRSLPGIDTPEKLQFPLQTPADGAQRIESSLDDALTTPVNYNWNISVGRELPGGLFIEASYLGRVARDLLATRDIMHLNNIVDQQSGASWYTAAAELMDHRLAGTAIEQIPDIPFFENLFPNYPSLDSWVVWDPALSATKNIFAFVSRDGFDTLDWTFLQAVLDDVNVPDLFFQPQYAALATWSTVANSDYHAFTLTLRERFKDSLTFDFNYTWSKSMDMASGLQDATSYSTAGFILNPLRPEDFRSVSDFDIQHIINSNWLWEMPIGRGRSYGTDLPGVLEAIVGGWSVNGVFRWNSGLPWSSPYEASRWATNWNAASNAVRTRDPQVKIRKDGDNPNIWNDPLYAYQSYRDAYAGESGDRNVLRLQSFFTLDFGLHKRFVLPYAEGHSLVFRWEVFNATNTQRLGDPDSSRDAWGTSPDPQMGVPAPSFGNINKIQGMPRVMQFGLRYEF